MTRALGTDTTPPSAISTYNKPHDGMGPSFKTLMGEMARMFPQLPPALQEQARQANNHVQFLIRSGNLEQAMGLMSHMKDIMNQLINVPEPPPFSTDESEAPIVKEAREDKTDPIPSIPPLPSSSSVEMKALQRSVEELQLKLKETSAVTLIAKRVRDVELEKTFSQLSVRLTGVKNLVGNRIDVIQKLVQQAEVLAMRESKKRTVTKNPFCDHEPTGFCQFCVGRDFPESDETIHANDRKISPSQPPVLDGVLKEDLINKEQVIQMTEQLRGYQQTLNELVKKRRSELNTLRAMNSQI
jgi:hypothetical protein